MFCAGCRACAGVAAETPAARRGLACPHYRVVGSCLAVKSAACAHVGCARIQACVCMCERVFVCPAGLFGMPGSSNQWWWLRPSKGAAAALEAHSGSCARFRKVCPVAVGVLRDVHVVCVAFARCLSLVQFGCVPGRLCTAQHKASSHAVSTCCRFPVIPDVILFVWCLFWCLGQ